MGSGRLVEPRGRTDGQISPSVLMLGQSPVFVE